MKLSPQWYDSCNSNRYQLRADAVIAVLVCTTASSYIHVLNFLYLVIIRRLCVNHEPWPTSTFIQFIDFSSSSVSQKPFKSAERLAVG